MGAQHSFYRVLRIRDVRLDKATASGGAEVFGFGDAFLNELDRLGQISPADFAVLHPQPTYSQGIDWDPTTARFWEDMNLAPEDKPQDKSDEGVALPRYDLRLDEREKAVLRKNGFVVSERLATESFGESFYRLWNDDVPVFVSTDSMLQAWHRSYDAMLVELEETSLFFLIEQMLDGMSDGVQDAAEAVGNGALKESVLDADLFIAVARSLLAGTPKPSDLGQGDRVAATLDLIQKEELVSCFELFGHPRTMDFSQFKVRGHYENSERLRRYFKCLMWLGRTDLRVAGPEFSDCFGIIHQPYEREMGTAVVLHHLLREAGQFENWLQCERVVEAFVGWTDSMTFAQLGELLTATGIRTLADVPDLDTLRALQERINKSELGAQNIKSDYFVAPLGPERLALPRSFTVFGQKFVLDSWVTAKTVFDDILWTTDGGTDEVPRRVPSALDVAFAALKNDQVVPELVARIMRPDAGRSTDHAVRWRDGMPYQHNLEAVRRVIDGQSADSWRGNLYLGWLDVLRTLSEPTTDARYPDAMRTRAWAMKTLNTQLASWTELRHDTILYAKQSYTPDGQCSYPDGYVEPRPEFFARLEALALRAANLIGALPIPPFRTVQIASSSRWGPGDPVEIVLTSVRDAQVAFWNKFAGYVGRLRGLAEKELRGERLSGDDIRFLDRLIQSTRPNGAGGPRQYDGWYTEMFYRNVLAPADSFQSNEGAQRWDALVADVHTDLPCDICGDPGSVLHQATGNVHLLVLTVDHGNEKMLYAGPVLSHYEFELVGPPKRLSDIDWLARWNKAGFDRYTPQTPDTEQSRDWSEIPPHPEWTRSYLVPHPTRP